METSDSLPTSISKICPVGESTLSEEMQKVANAFGERVVERNAFAIGAVLVAIVLSWWAWGDGASAFWHYGKCVLAVACVVTAYVVRRNTVRLQQEPITVAQTYLYRRLTAFAGKAHGFKVRLEALSAFEKSRGASQVDAAVISKYADEREQMLVEQGRLDQEIALINFETAVAACPQEGPFRNTRDVSDFVFTQQQRLRVADAEMASILEEDPRAAEPFRMLERAERQNEQ